MARPTINLSDDEQTHVWGIPPMRPVERQLSPTPEDQFFTYHMDNSCDEAPANLRRIPRDEAADRDLWPCPECVETGDDEAGGLLARLL